LFEVYHFKEAELILFMLILVRVSCMLATMPIFGTRMIPPQVKVLLSFCMTLVMFPIIKLSAASLVPQTFNESIILLIIREVFFGLFMGFLMRLIFMSVEIAGQILSITLGLSAAQLVNPAFNEPNSIVEQFETILGTLLFLAINGHHLFFEALYRSFELAPLGILAVKSGAMNSVTTLTSEIFAIGVKLAGPMIAVILFLNLALGVVGRAVPQINVFVISFPINILVGLFIFMVSIPLLLVVMESDFMVLSHQLFTFVKGF
jgi:flagellar biosynthetic protein FliR